MDLPVGYAWINSRCHCTTVATLTHPTSPARAARLRPHLELHRHDAVADHAEVARGGAAEVDDAAVDVGAAIGDPHEVAQAVRQVRHLDQGAAGQGAVRGRHLAGIEVAAATYCLGLVIEARQT